MCFWILPDAVRGSASASRNSFDHAGDKRVRMLALTPATSEAMPGWRRQVRRHEDRFLHRLTKKERATLPWLLRLIWTDED